MGNQSEDQDFITSVVKHLIGGICVFEIHGQTRQITQVFEQGITDITFDFN